MDDQAADDPRASHAALFYRTPEEFTAAASDYLHAGLIAGEAVFVASAGSHADLLRSLLGPQRSPSALADLAECGANPGRVLSMLRMFAGEHRGRAVRCVQDQYWPGRPLEEVAEAMRHEALVGMALAGPGSACYAPTTPDSTLTCWQWRRPLIRCWCARATGCTAPCSAAQDRGRNRTSR